MTKFKLPYIWEMYGVLEVEAATLADAMARAEDMPLPPGEYIDGSFVFDEDGFHNLNPDHGPIIRHWPQFHLGEPEKVNPNVLPRS